MQNFKQFLKEAKIDFAPWHITDTEELKNTLARRILKLSSWTDEMLDSVRGQNKIQEVLARGDLAGITFNKNGTVTFKRNDQYILSRWCVNIPDGIGLPFQIQSAKQIKMRLLNLVSVWGAPMKCDHLEIMSDKLKTLEHLNSTIENSLSLDTCNLTEFNCKVKANGLYLGSLGMTSLSGIQKHFELSDYINFNCREGGHLKIDSHIMGVLLIKGGLKRLSCSFGVSAAVQREWSLVKATFIINKHLEGDKDVMECHEELTRAGLKEYAKL